MALGAFSILSGLSMLSHFLCFIYLKFGSSCSADFITLIWKPKKYPKEENRPHTLKTIIKISKPVESEQEQEKSNSKISEGQDKRSTHKSTDASFEQNIYVPSARMYAM